MTNFIRENCDRLLFVAKRGGIAAARDFAYRSMIQYRRAALSGKRKYSHRFFYRRAYIESYIANKNYAVPEISR